MKRKHKTSRSSFLYFGTIVGSSLLAVTHASAADYYWDSDGDGTAGFGTAAGTWSSAGTGNLWSTSPTGDGVGGGAVADYVTTTSDNLYFGTPEIPTSGTITINGVVNANSVFSGTANLANTSPTINFSAAGTYERANNNGSFPTGTTFTGLGTSLTWKSQRNFNVSNVTHSAAKVILSTASTSIFPYPGRTVMDSSANLGATNAPLVFDGGTLRMASGFPYTTLSALHADHPVSFVADKDAGIENLHTAIFTADLAIDLGTGTFWPESSSFNTIVLTQANTWGQINLTSAVVEVSESTQLGPITSPIQFGSGSADLAAGTLKIAGTTFSDFGARPFQTTDTKNVAFEIVEAAHTFTLDRVLDMGTGDLSKSGNGTLALTEANTYTGPTAVTDGTLALVGGSQASDITVSSGASLGFTIGSATTSTASVDLTNGSVAITNPGAVDDSSDYLLMTASTGFTFTDITTQLGTTVTGYELQLQNSDTELWLVVASSGTDYATWAGGFTLTDATFNGDDDGDGLDNGLEAFFGTDPSVSSTGLAEVGKSANEVTFTHPNPDEADVLTDVTGSYEWSLDMVTWYKDDGVEGPGATTVTTVATADSPAANTTTVVATIGGTVPEKLFLRVVATQP